MVLRAHYTRGDFMAEVLVCEYFVAGGEREFDPQIGSEGLAVLAALVREFNMSGFKVKTLLRKEVAWLKECLPAADVTIVRTDDEFLERFREVASSCEYVALMAPESGGVLLNLVEAAIESGTKVLGPNPEAILLGTDKLKTLELARRLNIPVPSTLPITKMDTEGFASATRELGYPVVIKPRYGVGCEDVYLVRNNDDLAKCLKSLSKSQHEEFLVQEYVPGVDASVSVIANGVSCAPLTLNRQFVRISPPLPGEGSMYGGGYTPLSHSSGEKAIAYSKKLLERASGFYGYVGLDFVLTNEDAVLMEINPRFTTSLVGIVMVISRSISTILLESTVERRLPTNLVVRGFSRFSKVIIEKPRTFSTSLYEVLMLDEVLCPPLMTSDGRRAYAFISAAGASLRIAEEKFHSTLKRLEGASRGRVHSGT